jgi:hypothetical protein
MADRIGGASLSSEAKEVLRERHSPMHYTEILAELEKRGVSPNGREPGATLLAALGRAEGVEAVGRRSGFYKLHGNGRGDVLDKARWIITIYEHDRWMPAEAGVDLAHAVELHFRGEVAEEPSDG